MKNEVQTKQDNFLAPLSDKASWGPAPTLSQRDIEMPRIYLMQGLSEMVTSGQAKFGELVDSVSGEVLGGVGKPMEVIPISAKKITIVEEKQGKDWIFKEALNTTPEVEQLPFEEGNIRRTRIVSFFVLLPSEVASGAALPKILSIKGTSTQAAKIMLTQMYAINAASNPWLPPPAFTMLISVKVDKNDKGTFGVLEAKKGRRTTDEELSCAFHWNETIQKSEAARETERAARLEQSLQDQATVQTAQASAEAVFKKSSPSKKEGDPRDF